jgi:carbamate kinase
MVIAVGGNALLGTDERGVTDPALDALAAAVAGVAHAHEVAVTHGSGPQVGALAARVAAASPEPVPLDVVDAEVDGYLGYALTRALGSALPGRDVVAVLTQVLVDPDDAAFATPTKPVGPFVDAAAAAALADRYGWTFHEVGAADAHARLRRVVPSPAPVAVLERRSIDGMLTGGAIVIAAGGGGIPVRVDTDGRRVGVEAVVDKDRTSALLATDLGADRLVLLTDVEAVIADFGTARARPIGAVRAADLRASDYPAGSMGPKVQSAVSFVTATGGTAAIGSVTEAAAVVAGRRGTQIGDRVPGTTRDRAGRRTQ